MMASVEFTRVYMECIGQSENVRCGAADTDLMFFGGKLLTDNRILWYLPPKIDKS